MQTVEVQYFITVQQQHNNHFMALCPRLPVWAGTTRNTHHPPSWSEV